MGISLLALCNPLLLWQSTNCCVTEHMILGCGPALHTALAVNLSFSSSPKGTAIAVTPFPCLLQPAQVQLVLLLLLLLLLLLQTLFNAWHSMHSNQPTLGGLATLPALSSQMRILQAEAEANM
jgi:hypothetical protein